MIKEAINTFVNGENLNDEVMTQVMEEIMTGEARKHHSLQHSA